MSAIKAVFVGDSKRFHKFQIVNSNVVGTLYVPKEGDMSKELTIELVSKAHPEFDALSAAVAAAKM